MSGPFTSDQCARRGMAQFGSGIPSRAERRGQLGCGGRCSYDCLPLLTLVSGLAFGLWSVFLYSINLALAILPSGLLVLCLGATTKFSRSRMRRFVRIWCGRTTYEIIMDANPFSRDEESEDDEMDWRETSGSDDEDMHTGANENQFYSSTSSDADAEIDTSDEDLSHGGGGEGSDHETGSSDNDMTDDSSGQTYASDDTEELGITILTGGIAQEKPKGRNRRRGAPEVV